MRAQSPAPTSPSMPVVLWTAEQLAARWQVTKGQVYRLAREGVIPVTPIGRYYRFRQCDIERWEAAGGCSSDAESVRAPLHDAAQSPHLPGHLPRRAA